MSTALAPDGNRVRQLRVTIIEVAVQRRSGSVPLAILAATAAHVGWCRVRRRNAHIVECRPGIAAGQIEGSRLDTGVSAVGDGGARVGVRWPASSRLSASTRRRCLRRTTQCPLAEATPGPTNTRFRDRESM